MKTLINAFPSTSLLVIGDVMLDEYHWCEVSRISPEAPVPVCKVKTTTLVPGGAANVAHNIKALGATVFLIGTIGKDSSGEKLKSLLNEAHIETEGLIHTPEKPTVLKSRIIAHHQHVARVDRESTDPLSERTLAQIQEKVRLILPKVSCVLISDYEKGTLPESMLKFIIENAKTHNLPIIVDPKGDSYTKYKGATLLTPNFAEFTAISPLKLSSEEIIFSVAKNVIEALNLEALLVTRSEKGMSLITRSNKLDIPTKAKEVFDITGAGDTVIATLATALSAGASLEKAASIANHAAGIVVGKMGTAPIHFSELEQEFCDN